jgi:hypothetical protein
MKPGDPLAEDDSALDGAAFDSELEEVYEELDALPDERDLYVRLPRPSEGVPPGTENEATRAWLREIAQRLAAVLGGGWMRALGWTVAFSVVIDRDLAAPPTRLFSDLDELPDAPPEILCK